MCGLYQQQLCLVWPCQHLQHDSFNSCPRITIKSIVKEKLYIYITYDEDWETETFCRFEELMYICIYLFRLYYTHNWNLSRKWWGGIKCVSHQWIWLTDLAMPFFGCCIFLTRYIDWYPTCSLSSVCRLFPLFLSIGHLNSHPPKKERDILVTVQHRSHDWQWLWHETVKTKYFEFFDSLIHCAFVYMHI